MKLLREYIREIVKEDGALGVTKQILLTALALGVPVYDTERDVLWSPK